MTFTNTVTRDSIIPCTIKQLPPEQRRSAAERAVQINPNNAPAIQQLAQAQPGTVISPDHLALLTAKYWGNDGVRLTVGFLDNPTAELRARILSHMNAWGQYANVQFTEALTDPQVRISRGSGGYWSYLGTDILSIPANQQTMNLDGFTMNTADGEFNRVIRHETGHTLGFPHEHLRSEIVGRIDREKAIAYFMRTQGWSRDQVIAQVLTALDSSALIASAQADPDSIMCYWLPAEIMADNVAVSGGRDIDSQDGQFASSVYPLTNAVYPFFRYYNGKGCDHFYTTGWGELGPGASGWGFEGIQCYVYPNQRPGMVPLYRYWNGQGCDHFYTTSWEELGQGGGGWNYEGIQCYVHQDQQPGTIPLYRYWNGNGCDHFYTTSWGELGEGGGGWNLEGIQCYVFAQPGVHDAASKEIFRMQGLGNEAIPATFRYAKLNKVPHVLSSGSAALSSSFASNGRSDLSHAKLLHSGDTGNGESDVALNGGASRVEHPGTTLTIHIDR